MIHRSGAVSRAGWGSAFPSETTTDSSLLGEREGPGSGCVWRVRRGKGCLRPLSAWGSCRPGEDDQESPYFSFPRLLTPSGGPPLLPLPLPLTTGPTSLALPTHLCHPSSNADLSTTPPMASPGPSAAGHQNSVLPAWLRNVGFS